MKSFLLLTSIMIGSLFSTSSAQSLDPTFGDGGVAIIDSQIGAEEVEGVVLQSDGKILVMGDSFIDEDGDFYVLRVNENGTVDVDFGENGLAHQFFSDILNDSAEDAVVLEDGKIMVLGRMIYPPGALAPVFVRLNSDGTLDTSFAGNGYNNFPLVEAVDEYPQNLHVTSTGGFLVTGRIGNLGSANLALIAFAANGGFDYTYGSGGYTVIDVLESFDTVQETIILEDDGVIGAGWSFDPDAGSDRLLLVKFTANGFLDDSFGDDGVIIGEDSGGQDTFRAIARYGNDHFLATGYITPGGERDIIVSRYNLDGIPDETFGDFGHATLDYQGYDDRAVGVVELSDGSIIVGARTETDNGENDDFALIKLTANGSLDESFGDGGWFIHNETSGDVAEKMVVQPDGKVILAGSVSQEGMEEDIMMIRVDGVGPTGLPETREPEFYLSPNPAQSVLRVSGDRNINEVAIITSEGRIVNKFDNKNLPFELNISNLASGQYFLRIDGISQSFVKGN